MVNTQTLLNNIYPTKKERELIEELDIRNLNLEGELTISDWPNLKTIKCGNNKGLESIKLINLPQLTYFHASNCQLDNIIIDDCPNIISFNVANNLLTETGFLRNSNLEKLKCLSIHSNDFQNQDLSFLSNFVNLEQLFLDNHDQEKFVKGIYNHFTGSLEPLKSLIHLKYLNIANTDIDSGLEYLPESLKKICLINSWQRKKVGYSKIRWQLERVARFSGMTEKLQQKEKNEPPFVKDWYRLAPWRKAQKLLGKAFKNQTKQREAQTWLDENIPPNVNRQHYRELDLNDKNLTGELDLSDFTGLEKLDCSYNQLIDLNLTNCQNLIELNCSNNQFTDTKFLKKIPNPKKLEILRLNNNELKENLGLLSPFTNLKELDLSNCSFFGGLEPLKDMNNLKKVSLGHTDVNSGLDYLSDSCWELYCDPDTKSKSRKIANILAKYLESRNNEKYYNLIKWREELRNNIISSIPIERLFVIRGNIKQFLNRWGVRKKNELSELSKLKSPESPDELRKYRWTIYGVQFIGRSSAIVGAVLTFQGRSNEGAGILAIYPFSELVVSKLEKNLETEKDRWKEFLIDADTLLDNYHELKGIIEQIEEYKLGGANKALTNLNDKVKKLLEEYDKPSEENGKRNGIIDISELISQEARKKLAGDLSKEDKEKGGGSQLGDIVLAIKELENEIRNYRRGFYYGVSEEESEANKSVEQNSVESQQKQSIHSIIDMNSQTKQEDTQQPTQNNLKEFASLIEQPLK